MRIYNSLAHSSSTVVEFESPPLSVLSRQIKPKNAGCLHFRRCLCFPDVVDGKALLPVVLEVIVIGGDVIGNGVVVVLVVRVDSS